MYVYVKLDTCSECNTYRVSNYRYLLQPVSTDVHMVNMTYDKTC